MKLKRIVVTALTLGAIALGSASIGTAAEATNPLDPAYKSALEKMRTDFFEMLKVMDPNMTGRISREAFIGKHDPLSPEFKQRSAMFDAMDTNHEGSISLEQYMAAANPLHPAHKFTKN
jgi:hypothetical protein